MSSSVPSLAEQLCPQEEADLQPCLPGQWSQGCVLPLGTCYAVLSLEAKHHQRCIPPGDLRKDSLFVAFSDFEKLPASCGFQPAASRLQRFFLFCLSRTWGLAVTWGLPT